eukprot:TRINITY_DN66783_c3_g1_i1.p1 TRINITY_DN66783_c3_g1~~TRINITY_DN66783_c3_g1_i1.p1  ORF type:complete len:140 (-),score=14.17 TRINITY_DN66783_c3_g1_i1:49-468(-)
MDDFFAEVDKLHKDGAIQECYDKLQAKLAENPDNVDVMWRAARSCYMQAQEKTDKADKEALFRKGLEIAENAVKADPTKGQPHKWVGICLSKIGDFISTKEKIGNAYIIRDSFQKAVEVDEKDATSTVCFHWVMSLFSI